jgi:hypothetical protein
MLFFSGAAAARAVCLLNAVNGGRFRLGWEKCSLPQGGRVAWLQQLRKKRDDARI